MTDSVVISQSRSYIILSIYPFSAEAVEFGLSSGYSTV